MSARSSPSDARRRPPIIVLHGSEARPVRRARGNGVTRPFHGIASRGLLAYLGPDAAHHWPEWSPWLDPALEGDPAALESVPADLLTAARRCGVATFDAGARAAATFAAEELPALLLGLGAGFGAEEVERVELWNVKEGHTSSVWRLTVMRTGGRESVRAALNVARDDDAGDELLETATALERLRTCSRVPVAAVLATKSALSAPFVVAQEWVEDACELAFLRSRRDNAVRLHAIDRFLTDPHHPAQITGAIGRRLDDDEHQVAAHAATRLVLDGAELDRSSGTLLLPHADVTHGDWVWTDHGPCLVALSREREVIPAYKAREHLLGLWPRRHGVTDEHGLQLLGRAAAAAIDAAQADGTTILSSSGVT